MDDVHHVLTGDCRGECHGRRGDSLGAVHGHFARLIPRHSTGAGAGGGDDGDGQSPWITELMHNAGDATYEGEFRKEIARAEPERRFTSPTASRLFGELSAGLL